MEPTSSSNGDEELSDRVCWVCLESGLGEKQNDSWCHPCRCRGALKWVHHHCLQRWVDEQHAGQSTAVPVSCRVCGTQYEILYPEASEYCCVWLFPCMDFGSDMFTEALEYWE